MKPKLRELLGGAEGRTPIRLSNSNDPTPAEPSVPHPPRRDTDLCVKPWAAAMGSTSRAGNARGAEWRARPGRDARRRRRCGGPGSRALKADEAAARSRGHPCRARAPAPTRCCLPGAARPGPGGGSARGWRAGGAEEASGVTGGRGSGARQHAGGLGFSAGGRTSSWRPPCRSMVCEGKQRDLVNRGLGSRGGPRPTRLPPPALAGAVARPGGGGPERSARLFCRTRARAGPPGPPSARVPAHTRTIPTTFGLEEPGATRPRCAPLPLRVPALPCG